MNVSASDSYLQSPERIAELKDWKIVETSPGGVHLDFVNKRTKKSTWYTPKGMSPTEILAVPGAWKYWSTVEDVENYMEEMEDSKKINRYKDCDGSDVRD